MSDGIFAFVFPGQGSQKVGMLAEAHEAFDSVRQTFAEASETLGYDMWALVQAGAARRPEYDRNHTAGIAQLQRGALARMAGIRWPPAVSDGRTQSWRVFGAGVRGIARVRRCGATGSPARSVYAKCRAGWRGCDGGHYWPG